MHDQHEHPAYIIAPPNGQNEHLHAGARGAEDLHGGEKQKQRIPCRSRHTNASHLHQDLRKKAIQDHTHPYMRMHCSATQPCPVPSPHASVVPKTKACVRGWHVCQALLVVGGKGSA